VRQPPWPQLYDDRAHQAPIKRLRAVRRRPSQGDLSITARFEIGDVETEAESWVYGHNGVRWEYVEVR
jgi:hypothetical protein